MRSLRGSCLVEEAPAVVLEVTRAVAPAPLLNAGDRDHDALSRGGKDREVKYAVLLGADQLLAVDDKDRSLAAVLQGEAGDAPPFGDLGQGDGSGVESFLEGVVERPAGAASQEGELTRIASILSAICRQTSLWSESLLPRCIRHSETCADFAARALWKRTRSLSSKRRER